MTARDGSARTVALRHRFVLRVLLWTLLAALVPVVAVSWFSYVFTQRSLHNELRLRLLGVAERKAERLELWAATRRAAVTSLTRSPVVVSALASADGEAHDDARINSLAAELRVQVRSLGLGNLLVVDAHGRVLAATGGSLLVGRSLRDAALAHGELASVCERALTVGETEFTDFSLAPLMDGSAGGPHALLAAPVFDHGRGVGVLVGEIDNAEVQRVSSDLAGLGESGEIDVGGYVGSAALFVAPTRHDPAAAFHRTVASSPSLALALQGGRGDGVTRDYRGTPVYAVWRYVPSLRWGLVSQVDEAEALAPVLSLRAVTLGLTALALLMAALSAVLVSGRVSRPLQVLTREALLLAEGDLHRQVPVVGEDEFAQLGVVFNHMVTELRQHSEGLENEVAARTAELARANASLVESARRTEESVGLARQIQASMLPSASAHPPAVGKLALLWRPLAQVGGDLAFVEATPDGGFVAGVLDCTGHGVAAAMTAMFASALCSLALATHGAQGPAAVLREFDRRLANAFVRANDGGIALGLDVALVIAAPGQRVRFAGAGVGMCYRTRSGSVVELAGRARGLGYGKRRREASLVDHSIEPDDVDALYLFSDGILDEPVGADGSSLGRTRFKSMLEALDTGDVVAGLAALDREVIASRGARVQRDDVLVLALTLVQGALAARASSENASEVA